MKVLNVVVTSLVSVGVLFVLTKLSGHRQIAQLDLFDYLSAVTLGSVAAELATELEDPWRPLTALLVYGGVTVLANALMKKLPKSRKYINGTPTILLNRGKLYRENFKKAKIDLSEFALMCREAGYFDLNEIETAVFETNGRLSVLPKSEKRPLTPDDMNISLKRASVSTEVIMDGRIMGENLERLGLNGVWLEKELKKQKIKNAREVFYAVCDGENRLTVFTVE